MPLTKKNQSRCRRCRAADPVDRLHVTAAVARRHLQLPLDRLHRVEAGRDGARVEHLRAAVARHPERRRAVLALAPAATGEGERERETARHLTSPRSSGPHRPRSRARAGPDAARGTPRFTGPASSSRSDVQNEGRRLRPSRCRRRPACSSPGRRLHLEGRRAAGRAEGRVVPEHVIAVLQLHLVGADRRRDVVHLEHPAAVRAAA